MRKFFRRLSALIHRQSLERELEEEMAAPFQPIGGMGFPEAVTFR